MVRACLPAFLVLATLTGCPAPEPGVMYLSASSSGEDDGEGGNGGGGGMCRRRPERCNGQTSNGEGVADGTGGVDSGATTGVTSAPTTAVTAGSGVDSSPTTAGDSTGAGQSCDPGTATCSTANTRLTCADGVAVEEDCPNGTNCVDGACAPVVCTTDRSLMPAYENGGGGITVYWFNQGTVNFGDVNCAFGISVAQGDNSGIQDRVNYIADSALFGAIATADFDNAAMCGACVDLEYNGRSVTVTIADQCPAGSNQTCQQGGHIDLSRSAWNALGLPQNGGDFNQVTWRTVPCNYDQPMGIILKEPDNQYYKAFIVVQHEYPIAKAEFVGNDGTLVTAMKNGDGNYFYSPLGDDGGLTYRFRITDVNGGIIEQEVQGGVAGAQMGTRQFACQ